MAAAVAPAGAAPPPAGAELRRGWAAPPRSWAGMAAIRERAARAAWRLSKARLKRVSTRPGCGMRQSVAYPGLGFERVAYARCSSKRLSRRSRWPGRGRSCSMSSSTCARRILTICATPTSPMSSSLRCHAQQTTVGGRTVADTGRAGGGGLWRGRGRRRRAAPRQGAVAHCVLLQAAGLERLDEVWLDDLGLGGGRRRRARRLAAALRARRDGGLAAAALRALRGSLGHRGRVLGRKRGAVGGQVCVSPSWQGPNTAR